MSNHTEGTPTVRSRRASPMGAYVTLAGVALFTIAVFLDWLSGLSHRFPESRTAP